MRWKDRKDLVKSLLETEDSKSSILRSLGLKVTGGNFRSLNQYINYWGFDDSGLKGQAWMKNLDKNDPRIKAQVIKNKYPDSKVFIENSTYPTSNLFKRLIEDRGFDNKCSCCVLSDWMGKNIRLHVDHINGVNGDHRIENLRLLCPNCHSQTDTYGNKRSKTN